MNVYFVSSVTNPLLVKIGYAADVSKRVAELQTGNPFRLRAMHIIQMPSAKAAAACEALLHSTFADYRMQGEWFRNVGALTQLLNYLRQDMEPERAIQLAMRDVGSIKEQSIRHRNRKQRRILRAGTGVP